MKGRAAPLPPDAAVAVGQHAVVPVVPVVLVGQLVVQVQVEVSAVFLSNPLPQA